MFEINSASGCSMENDFQLEVRDFSPFQRSE
jgi:hypothetical protein